MLIDRKQELHEDVELRQGVKLQLHTLVQQLMDARPQALNLMRKELDLPLLEGPEPAPAKEPSEEDEDEDEEEEEEEEQPAERKVDVQVLSSGEQQPQPQQQEGKQEGDASNKDKEVQQQLQPSSANLAQEGGEKEEADLVSAEEGEEELPHVILETVMAMGQEAASGAARVVAGSAGAGGEAAG